MIGQFIPDEKFIADLSGCAEKPYWWRDGDPLVFQVVRGKHYLDFDVDESCLPKELIERMYECSICRAKAARILEGGEVDEAASIPFGFDLYDLKEFGGTLTKLED